MKDNNTIMEQIQNILQEGVAVNFNGHKLKLNVGVNEDPNKKGVKVQFIPETDDIIPPTERNDMAIDLEERLNQGLEKWELKVERDRNLKDKRIIGFFIYIEHLDRIIRKALGAVPSKEQEDGQV
jgi:hypothetical protein